MKLILINGRPGSGKTTLARQISKELDIKLICKDDIKEFLFDYVGSYGTEWSQMLGAKTSDFIMDLAEGILTNGKSVCVENAFNAKFAKPSVNRILKKFPDLEVVEVYCHADPELLKQRFINRVHSGERHPGHGDLSRVNDFNLSDNFEQIALGRIIKIDTTDFEKINHDKLISDLK